MTDTTVQVKVWGAYACFTRPDLKVERMTYPCMTASAARGVLDAILWKKEFAWYVRRISVLKPVNFVSIKRNELSAKQSKTPIIIEEKRTQRNSVVLRDVAYVIEASVENCVNGNHPKKYVEMFTRRVKKGQCYRRPFLGTREFSAEFAPVGDDDVPIKETYPIGSMLLDMYYDEKGVPKPVYVHDAVIRNGVLDCEEAYKEMLTSTHHTAGATVAYEVDERIAKEEDV